MRASGLSQLGQRTTDPPISWLMRLPLERPQLISLAAGFTDDLSLPVEEAKVVVAEILSSPRGGRAALQYGTTLGHLRLRQLTAKRLRERDGVGAARADVFSVDRTLITHGSQQLLYMLSECLCDPGDIVVVEDPTYFVYLGIVQSHGLRCRGITLESDGLDLRHLERTLDSLKAAGELHRVKMLYAVTYFQNPTGITTSLEKKAGALDLLRYYEQAAGHPIYLLEDAAYRELRFQGNDVPSALSLEPQHRRVIYSGTYSKPFATGIRVGYGLLPPALLPIVARVKGNHDFGTANFLQHLLARALESCRYTAHLTSLQQRYAGKARMMVKALCQHFPPEVTWQDPSGGMYIWARIPGHLSTGPGSALFQRALAHDVLYVPGELCYAPDPTRPIPKSEMRLSFGHASETDLRQGVARLGKVLFTALARSSGGRGGARATPRTRSRRLKPHRPAPAAPAPGT